MTETNSTQRTGSEALERLRRLPRYRNTRLKSLFCRARFFANILLCRSLRIARPLFVVLVTNNDCNLSCAYCYGRYGERSPASNYSTGELIEIIDGLWALGTRNITLHGGESLLRSDIGEIVNYAKLKGFYVSLNSNGILIPRKIADLSAVDAVCISLDGRESAHDAARGKGSFRIAMQAIETVSAWNIPLAVHATLTRHNIEDMEYLAELARTKGFRLQFSILYNSGSLQAHEILSDREIREWARRILGLKAKGYPIYYSSEVLDALCNWPYPIDERTTIDRGVADKGIAAPAGQISCYHGALKYMIDADGRVVTCWGHDSPDAPNIRTAGLKAALMQCATGKTCRCCCYLANNEHNLMFELRPGALLGLMLLQVGDVVKRGKWRRLSFAAKQ